MKKIRRYSAELNERGDVYGSNMRSLLARHTERIGTLQDNPERTIYAAKVVKALDRGELDQLHFPKARK